MSQRRKRRDSNDPLSDLSRMAPSLKDMGIDRRSDKLERRRSKTGVYFQFSPLRGELDTLSNLDTEGRTVDHDFPSRILVS